MNQNKKILEYLKTDEFREYLNGVLLEFFKQEIQENQVPGMQNMEVVAVSDPTPEELVEANKMRPSGTDPYEASEIKILKIFAADNLVNRENMAWTQATLESMAETYKGGDLTFDHLWESAKQTFGFVLDAEVMNIPSPDMELLKNGGKLDQNLEIAQMDGVYRLLVTNVVAVDTARQEEIMAGIRFRRLSDVSVGGQFFGELICPECRVQFGAEDERTGELLCNHFPPSRWAQYYLSEAELKRMKSYALRDGTTDMVELSVVMAGKAPNAGIPSSGK